jgi:hypothetical protein
MLPSARAVPSRRPRAGADCPDPWPPEDALGVVPDTCPNCLYRGMLLLYTHALQCPECGWLRRSEPRY